MQHRMLGGLTNPAQVISSVVAGRGITRTRALIVPGLATLSSGS